MPYSFDGTTLANVNNAMMKQLVAKMAAAKLSPKTIVNYTGLVKLVVASAKDEEGELLFPRKWDSEFIDLLIVTNQRQPKFCSETMSAIVEKTTDSTEFCTPCQQALDFV